VLLKTTSYILWGTSALRRIPPSGLSMATSSDTGEVGRRLSQSSLFGLLVGLFALVRLPNCFGADAGATKARSTFGDNELNALSRSYSGSARIRVRDQSHISEFSRTVRTQRVYRQYRPHPRGTRRGSLGRFFGTERQQERPIAFLCPALGSPGLYPGFWPWRVLGGWRKPARPRRTSG
jgi:hypothetical protein